MKKIIVFTTILLTSYLTSAQNNWFKTYADSTELLKDAAVITTKFTNDIKKLNPNLAFKVKTIHNTTPYLIYYDDADKTANLPLWTEVISEEKQFFYTVAGDEQQGKEAFGLFF